ncbi:MAG: VCBS repeat-containing protein [Verrucomicrobiota bacterium]
MILCLGFALPGSAREWKRHTIDNSSEGADGVRLHDVNGDGRQDIATAWEEGNLIRAYVHPGTGKAKHPWPAVTVGKVRAGEDAVFADLDGDGAVDVVSSCEGNTKSLFVHWAPDNAADFLNPGAWKTEAFPQCRNRTQWMYALPMQVDGKNGIDLIVAGKGNGSEIGWLSGPENPRDLPTWVYRPIHPMGWVMSLQREDMDGDGDLDVLYSDRRGPSRGVHWLEWTGRGWKHHTIGGTDSENMFLATGDLDGDGRREIVVAIRQGPIHCYRHEGSQWVRHEIPLPKGFGSGKSVAVVDVDGNGKSDLIFSCESAESPLSGIGWLSATGNPFSEPWQSHDIGGPEGIKFDRLTLNDVDGDGDTDVLTCEERDQLGVLWYENPFGARGKN